MAYSFQTFSIGQVLTATQMNQVEINIRDHQHGNASVTGTMGAISTGTLTVTSTGVNAFSVTANSDWAVTIANLGTTDANGLYVNLGASSTGVPFRIDKDGSQYLSVSNLGAVTINQGLSVGTTFDLTETSAPSGVANTARLFAVDSGGGKTILKVQFGSGSAITIATEA